MDVAVQLMFFDMLEQRSSRSVHDALGRAGRSRGIQNVQRVIEGKPLEVDRFARLGLEYILIPNRRDPGGSPSSIRWVQARDALVVFNNQCRL